MLELCLADCGNLLITVNRFAAGMLQGFAGQYPDRVRAMLVDLFDESKDLFERIDAFKKECDDWREETKGWSLTPTYAAFSIRCLTRVATMTTHSTR